MFEPGFGLRFGKATNLAAACGQTAVFLGLVVAFALLRATPSEAAFDAACTKHLSDTNPATHDPKISIEVEKLAVELLSGEPNFARDWNAYMLEMRKGNPDAAPDAPDLPNAIDRLRDAETDLHCAAPIEARLTPLTSKLSNLFIDTWRSYVNASVYNLSTGQFNIQQAQELINKVRPGDRDIAAADFTRDCNLFRLHFTAHANAAGMIEVSEKN
jgi:hypothetical protein